MSGHHFGGRFDTTAAGFRDVDRVVIGLLLGRHCKGCDWGFGRVVLGRDEGAGCYQQGKKGCGECVSSHDDMNRERI